MQVVTVLTFGPSERRPDIAAELAMAVAEAGHFAIALDMAAVGVTAGLTERLLGNAQPGPGVLDAIAAPADSPGDIALRDAAPTIGVGPFPEPGRLWVASPGDPGVRLPLRPALDAAVTRTVDDIARTLSSDAIVIDGPYAHSALALAVVTQVSDEIVLVTPDAPDDVEDARGVLQRLNAEFARSGRQPRLHVAVLPGAASDAAAPEFGAASVHRTEDDLGPLAVAAFGDLVAPAAPEPAETRALHEPAPEVAAILQRVRVVSCLEQYRELTERHDFVDALPVVVTALDEARNLEDTHEDRTLLARALVAHSHVHTRLPESLGGSVDTALLSAIEARAVGDLLIAEDDTLYDLRADAEDVMAEACRIGLNPEGIEYSYAKAVEFRRRHGVSDLESRLALVSSLHKYGTVVSQSGRPDEGLTLLGEAAALLESIAGETGRTAERVQAATAEVLTDFGDAMAAVDDEQAVEVLTNAVMLLQTLLADDKNFSAPYARASLLLARELRARGYHEQAESTIGNSERVYRWLREAIPGYEGHHAGALAESARILAAAGRTPAALEPAEEAVRAYEQHYSATGVGIYALIDLELELSDYRAELGWFDESQAHGRRAEQWCERLGETDPPAAQEMRDVIARRLDRVSETS